MEVKISNKCKPTGPLVKAVEFARGNGFTLNREPFGKSGMVIEVYQGDRKVGYRKSYAAALVFMKNLGE